MFVLNIIMIRYDFDKFDECLIHIGLESKEQSLHRYFTEQLSSVINGRILTLLVQSRLLCSLIEETRF